MAVVRCWFLESVVGINSWQWYTAVWPVDSEDTGQNTRLYPFKLVCSQDLWYKASCLDLGPNPKAGYSLYIPHAQYPTRRLRRDRSHRIDRSATMQSVIHSYEKASVHISMILLMLILYLPLWIYRLKSWKKEEERHEVGHWLTNKYHTTWGFYSTCDCCCPKREMNWSLTWMKSIQSTHSLSGYPPHPIHILPSDNPLYSTDYRTRYSHSASYRLYIHSSTVHHPSSFFGKLTQSSYIALSLLTARQRPTSFSPLRWRSALCPLHMQSSNLTRSTQRPRPPGESGHHSPTSFVRSAYADGSRSPTGSARSLSSRGSAVVSCLFMCISLNSYILC